MDGPYRATLSSDKAHWIVTSAHGGACLAPHREGQANQFDFTSEDLARTYAEQYNREIAQWLAGREGVRIYQAIEDRAASWREAAEMYARTQPGLAASMERNAQVMELLLQLQTERGIEQIAKLVPGYTSMPLPGTDPVGETPPRRGSAVEAWLKARRDRYDRDDSPEARAMWDELDEALDDLRLRADLGAPWTGRMIDYGDGRPEHVPDDQPW